VSLLGTGGIIVPAHAQDLGNGNLVAAVETGSCKIDDTFAIAIHGGAVFERGDHGLKVSFVQNLLVEARSVLVSGARATDVVEAVVAAMEDSGHFNAGRGSIANEAGVIEMDAAIMEGQMLEAGAVASVETVRNPISAARSVMENSRHVMLGGPDADRFVKEKGGMVVDVTYFLNGGQNFGNVPLPEDIAVKPPSHSLSQEKAAFSGAWAGRGDINHVLVVEEVDPEGAKVIYALGPHPSFGAGQYRRLKGDFLDGGLKVMEPSELGGYTLVYRLNPDGTLTAKATAPGKAPQEATLRRYTIPKKGHGGGTVGAVVRDRCTNLAAGTSTGGFDAKIPGRVGDSPIIGAGTYADNETAAISATGHGEYFMRYVAAHAIAAAMKYKGVSLEDAATGLIKGDLARKGLRGGIIAVDREGNVSMPFNTDGMVRGVTTNDLSPSVSVY
jgi:beta-aspartyl-peptidase (threonine type)